MLTAITNPFLIILIPVLQILASLWAVYCSVVAVKWTLMKIHRRYFNNDNSLPQENSRIRRTQNVPLTTSSPPGSSRQEKKFQK